MSISPGFSSYPYVRLGRESSIQFARSGIPEKQLRKMRQGKVPIQAEIDLHGLDRHAAQAALSDFLYDCCEQRFRWIKVIHGKGWDTKEGESCILKNHVCQALKSYPKVLAFCSAPPRDGGNGAIYALLKTRRV